MTPAARIAAAIEILDRVLAGDTGERALTGWGRASRYAGSGDRLAVRDMVFDALRCRRSFAHLGGADSGRGLMLGRLRDRGEDPAAMFTGGAYGPAPLTATEATEPPPMPDLVALDCPDWLAPALRAALGEDFAAVMGSLRARAPVFLRVNAARATRDDALAALAGEGVLARPHSLANFALEVTDGARKIERTQAYLGGLVELQDASSQAVVEALPLADGMRVLDHCAGGGGKTLAMAARAKLTLWAHDIAPRRMADLPERAARAGIGVTLTEAPEATAPYDLVLVDAPCSGSGSWRRDPEGKWALTPERLEAVRTEQAAILDRAAAMVASGGALAYATCSLLHAENGAQVDAFLKRSPGWAREDERSFLPTSGGDGFYLGVMRRN